MCKRDDQLEGTVVVDFLGMAHKTNYTLNRTYGEYLGYILIFAVIYII